MKTPEAPAFSTMSILSLRRDGTGPVEEDRWDMQIPAVRHLLEAGLDLGPLTILVGENGSGKSTIVEAIAAACGLNPEGGTHHAMRRTQFTESPLHRELRLVRGAGASRAGVFVRAETMFDHLGYLESVRSPGRLNHQSHGESFIEYFSNRSGLHGLWLLDEPESALSFSSCLALVLHLRNLLSEGAQIILATHSPILASLPGAALYELGAWGMRPTEYDDFEMVSNWRLFLDAPDRFLRHLQG